MATRVVFSGEARSYTRAIGRETALRLLKARDHIEILRVRNRRESCR